MQSEHAIEDYGPMYRGMIPVLQRITGLDNVAMEYSSARLVAGLYAACAKTYGLLHPAEDTWTLPQPWAIQALRNYIGEGLSPVGVSYWLHAVLDALDPSARDSEEVGVAQSVLRFLDRDLCQEYAVEQVQDVPGYGQQQLQG